MSDGFTKEHRAALKPFSTMVLAMYTSVAAMTDEQLAELGTAASSPSQTNCGWNEYEAAAILLPIVRGEQIVRKRRAEAA